MAKQTVYFLANRSKYEKKKKEKKCALDENKISIAPWKWRKC